MRISVVAPSEQYMALAGVRIRYQRIASRLEAAGYTFDIKQISEIDRRVPLESDLYIFSKCYDARSVLAATFMRSQGRCVGIDVFDDYFDQTRDSELIRHREWLRAMGEFCDFFLCSTPRMHDVVARYLPHAPGHILNDPFQTYNVKDVARLAQEKAKRAIRDRRIDVLWFGIGDNPNFHVGLKDLAAYGDHLQQMIRRGFDVDLRILTNRRAMTVEGLQSIGRLSVPHVLQEWSVEREDELLTRSLLAFIPVNGQSFSVAKSLNRAVTALTASAQILSPGYPLYKPLEDFVYDTADAFIDDLEGGKMKLRRATTAALAKKLAVWGDPERESEKLIGFLKAVVETPAATKAPISSVGVIHGVRSPVDCHKAAQRLGYLSVASPMSPPKWNYDVRFVFDQDGVHAQFSGAAKVALASEFLYQLTPGVSPAGKDVVCLSIKTVLPGHPLEAFMSDADQRSQISTYFGAMHLIGDVLSRLIPGIRLHLSELESPYWLAFGDEAPGKRMRIQ